MLMGHVEKSVKCTSRSGKCKIQKISFLTVSGICCGSFRRGSCDGVPLKRKVLTGTCGDS